MFSYVLIAAFLTMIIATQGRSSPKCEYCPRALISPICGSNGHLYESECDLRATNCWLGETVTEVPWGSCTQETCDPVCHLMYEPVCGEDGKIYHGNRCSFLFQSCGRETPLNEAPMSTCPDHVNLFRRPVENDASVE